MRAIFLKRRPKARISDRRGENADTVRSSSPLVYLNPQNQYSVSPCPKNCGTAVAYSKGKMSEVPAGYRGLD